MDNREWPEHFPAGCPPTSAVNPEGSVYRLIATDPPESGDFIPHAELPNRLFGGYNKCKACGLSVFLQATALKRLRERVPALGGYRYIAEASLDQDCGRIMHTPSSGNPEHHTWWYYQHVVPHRLFRVIEVV